MSRRPNIVLLMADQLRPDVLGCYGGRADVSPTLDALAGESVRFERHLTNCPLCVPARISLATGLWPHQHGAIVNGWDPGEAPFATCRDKPTYFELLAAAGYRVEHVGVSHLRCEPPIAGRHERIRMTDDTAAHRDMLRARGRVVDLSACKSPCVEYELGRPIVRDYTNPNTVPWPAEPEEFFDCFIADRAIERIEQADTSEPLALNVAFWSPHPPLTAPDPYYNMFDPATLTLPANVGTWYAGQSPMQLINLPGHVAAATTMDGWRRAWAVYLGMTRLLDDCIGRVLDALRRRGFLENCLLIFTSDHGEMLGSHRMFQKMCMYEESIRVPLLICPPSEPGRPRPGTGRRTPQIRPQLTQHLDLAATICDYADIDPPRSSSGCSFRDVVESANAPGRDEVFLEFNGNSGRSFQQRAVVTPGAKFIHNHGYAPEFYDTRTDPLETRNLCMEGALPSEASRLQTRLRAWMQDTGDCIAPPGDASGGDRK